MPKTFKFKFTTRDSLIEEIEAENEQEARKELQRRIDENLIEFYQMETEYSSWRLLPDENDTADGKKPYNVTITTEANATICIMAENADEAADKAEELFRDGEIDELAFNEIGYDPISIFAENENDENDTCEILGD